MVVGCSILFTHNRRAVFVAYWPINGFQGIAKKTSIAYDGFLVSFLRYCKLCSW